MIGQFKVDLEGEEVKDVVQTIKSETTDSGSGQKKVCVCRGEWGWYDKEG